MDLKSDVPIDVKVEKQQPATNQNKFHVDFDDSSSSCSLLSWKGSISSINRSLCRICQSETGTMIRPCACAGTMGKIHEHCLNEWVLHSRKECCEICKADYAKSGNALLPLREWKKPDISSANWIEIIALTGLIYSNFYIISLFEERQFLYRLFVERLPPREPDVFRMIMLFMVSAFLFGTVMDLAKKVKFYFRKQCKVRFVNNSELNTGAIPMADLDNKAKPTVQCPNGNAANNDIGAPNENAPGGSGSQRPQIIVNNSHGAHHENRTLVIEAGVSTNGM